MRSGRGVIFAHQPFSFNLFHLANNLNLVSNITGMYLTSIVMLINGIW